MLFASADQVREAVVDMLVTGGELRTKQVFGLNCSLMVASRSAGYHSEPHHHNCEQLNYVQRGQIWVFVEETAYHLRQGDFLRIRAGAIHWAWNRSDSGCELIEMHSPGLELPGLEDAPRLVEVDETPAPPAPSQWADSRHWAIEAQALAAHGVTL